jgi:hypothetical protein
MNQGEMHAGMGGAGFPSLFCASGEKPCSHREGGENVKEIQTASDSPLLTFRKGKDYQ